MASDFRDHRAQIAFAFRGYNVTNLGRSAELLARPDYGPTVQACLEEVSAIASGVLGRPIDLVSRVRQGEETSLETFAEAVALIMAVEVAQVRVLKEFHDVRLAAGKLAFGYSLGEVAALVCAGLLKLEEALTIPLSMAEDCASLAHETTMGVVFSRGSFLDVDTVRRLCLAINSEGRGIIGISSFLSPNTVLVLGQHDTVDRFRERIQEISKGKIHVRKNQYRWPPLHTPLLWEKCIPNRAARQMHTLQVSHDPIQPPVLSLATGKDYYTDVNCRELLGRWTDHPQRLWDAIRETLAKGIEVVVHVGPGPNIIPATFQRLSDNIKEQMRGGSINGLGLRAMSSMARRSWLTALLPAQACLLRAPYVEQIVLEDWLLAEKPD
jgi:[acyl-carrier-protein] S-malonyltransferase